MPYHWLDFTPPQPQIAAAPVEDFVTAASTRVSAATALLDRAWGKPLQGVAMMTVAAPKSVEQMSDAELIAVIQTKMAAGG